MIEDAHPEFRSLCLDRLKNFQRAPRGIKDALHTARNSSANSLERIFLDKGEVVWFSYFLLKSCVENQVTFDGKAACRKAIDKLKASNEEVWRSQAGGLAEDISVALQDKVLRRLGDTFVQSSRKRRCEICVCIVLHPLI
jgi:gamma-glutamyl phosphate reductase